MNSQQFHEDFSRDDEDVRSSDRSLGITFAVVLTLVGFVRLYHGDRWWIAWLVLAGIFLLSAYFWVAPLRPLGMIWHRFGHLLHWVVNPIIMAVLFYGAVLPVGLVLRVLGKDPLRLKIDRICASYWLERKPPGPAAQEMKNQF